MISLLRQLLFVGLWVWPVNDISLFLLTVSNLTAARSYLTLSLVFTRSPRVTTLTLRPSLTPTHSSEYIWLKSRCWTSCEKSFFIYPSCTFYPQSNESQAALLLPSPIKFSCIKLFQFKNRHGCMRLDSVWTATYDCSSQIWVKSKGLAMELCLYSNRMWDVTTFPGELRWISWLRILMWHLAVEENHPGNGKGAVLWPGITHPASGWQTGLAAPPLCLQRRIVCHR